MFGKWHQLAGFFKNHKNVYTSYIEQTNTGVQVMTYSGKHLMPARHWHGRIERIDMESI